uniref:Uncharacterized protein n=1 Tax=Strigamia maritima TaxID=126957 RepID=T1JP86_STRMM
MPRKLDFVKSVTCLGESKQKIQLRCMQSQDSVAAAACPFLRNLSHQSSVPTVTKLRFKEEFNSRQAQSCLNPDSVKDLKEVTFQSAPSKRDLYIWDSSRVKSLLTHTSWDQEKNDSITSLGKPEGSNLSSTTSMSSNPRYRRTPSQFNVLDDSNVAWHPNLQIAYNYFEDHGTHNKKLEDPSKQKLVNKRVRNLQYNHHHWKSSVFEDPRDKDSKNLSCVDSWSIVRNPITGLQVKYNRI